MHFPLNINLNALPKLTQNNSQATLDHLKLKDSSPHFSTFILKIFIKGRRTAHIERINSNRNLVILNPGDIVMTRTSIQSDRTKDKVAKL